MRHNITIRYCHNHSNKVVCTICTINQQFELHHTFTFPKTLINKNISYHVSLLSVNLFHMNWENVLYLSLGNVTVLGFFPFYIISNRRPAQNKLLSVHCKQRSPVFKRSVNFPTVTQQEKIFWFLSVYLSIFSNTSCTLRMVLQNSVESINLLGWLISNEADCSNSNLVRLAYHFPNFIFLVIIKQWRKYSDWVPYECSWN